MATYSITTTPQTVASASTSRQLFVNNGQADIVLDLGGGRIEVLNPGGPGGVGASAVFVATASVSASTRADTSSLDVSTLPADSGLAGSGTVALDDLDPSVTGTYAARGGLLSTPLHGVTTTALGASPSPLGVFGGYLWGQAGTTVSRSSDNGATWTTYATGAPAGLVSMLPTFDGEVVAVTGTTIYRTTGWAAGTPTWASKMTANGTAYFLRWGLSGDGTKFITTEYAVSGQWQDSRYVRISTDGGVTWSVTYDSVAKHGSTLANASHLHGAAYDPWSGRFYISEGHGSISGIYYSADDGATWARAAGMVLDPSPTVIVPTDDGLVLASDAALSGLFGALRQPNGADEVARRTYRWATGYAGVIGYGFHGFRDPATGVVYVGFMSSYPSTRPNIVAGTASAAAEVWRYVSAADTTGDAVTKVFIPAPGVLVAELVISTVPYRLTASLGRPGAQSVSLADTGLVLGGTAEGSGNVAVGLGSSVEAGGTQNTAVGFGAAVTGGSTQGSTAIGNGVVVATGSSTAIGSGASASGGNSVAAGTGASAGANAVAVGYNASASAAASVAVGAAATTNGQTSAVAIGAGAAVTVANCMAIGPAASAAVGQSVAVGQNAAASGGLSTAVGYGAAASNSDATALGNGAAASGWKATAVGRASAAAATDSTAIGISSSVGAAHIGSVALGAAQVTTSAAQVRVGAKHFEIAEITDPAAPAADTARLFVRDNGSGKTQLCIRFATGAVQVLSVEP